MLLYQPESGYCYNSDSIFLYDFINRFKPKGRVLDVGAGCGIVGLLVARDNRGVLLEAVEKQAAFVELAATNARVNKQKYQLYATDFLDFEADEKYDFIISNPPFYPKGVQKSENEMLFHARYNIHLPLDAFFKKVSQILKPHSHFIFCYDASQFAEICVALERVKMRVVDVAFVHPSVNKKASLVLIHARNGSRSSLNVLAPYVIYDGQVQTQETQKIFSNANTKSIKCQI